MAFSGVQFTTLFLLINIIVTLFLSLQVMSDDEEGHLLSALNSYRQSQGVQPLAKHEKAGCLADEIADELEDRQCPATGIVTVAPGSRPPQLDNYEDLVRKCKIDINSTQEGVILPVCVNKRVSPLVLTNYTQSQYATYVNSSKYTGAGIGKEDDWTVLVLTTNTLGGTFASAASCLSFALNYHPLFMMFMVLGLFFPVLN